jgi:hypothetical protein
MAPPNGAAGSDGLLGRFLAHAEPGQAGLMRFLIDEGMVTSMVIREDEEHVHALPSQPMIDVRAALLMADGGEPFGDVALVGVIVVLAKIENEIYETWLNRHFQGMGLDECLDDLAQQEKLLFAFYLDGPEPARKIWIPNRFRDEFAGYQDRIADLPPWSMEAFDRARMGIIQRLPSVQDLWEACGG